MFFVIGCNQKSSLLSFFFDNTFFINYSDEFFNQKFQEGAGVKFLKLLIFVQNQQYKYHFFFQIRNPELSHLDSIRNVLYHQK